MLKGRTPRVYSTAFKERAAQRLASGESASSLALELGVRRKLLYDWHRAWRRDGVAGLNRKRGPKPKAERIAAAGERRASGDALSQAQARIAELERLIGRQQVDLDFFHRALRLGDAASQNGTARTSTRSSKR